MNLNELTDYQRDFYNLHSKPAKVTASSYWMTLCFLLLAGWLLYLPFGRMTESLKNLGYFVYWLYFLWEVIMTMLLCVVIAFYSSDTFKESITAIPAKREGFLKGHLGFTRPSFMKAFNFLISILIIIGAAMNGYMMTSFILVIALVIFVVFHYIVKNKVAEIIKELSPH